MRTEKERAELLNKLLGGGIEPEILLFALERARELILNYCRLKELPAGLENTLLSLCVDIYRAEQPGKPQAVGAVKGITEGDVSVSYGSAASAAENGGMAFLKDYTKTLDRYRKAGW